MIGRQNNYPTYKYESGRVSSICTVIYSGARPDLVAYGLACLATKPENLDRFPGAHLFSGIFFLFYHFNVKLLHTSKFASSKEMLIPERFILSYA